MEGRPFAGRRVYGGGGETVSILRTAGLALLRSLQLYKPLVSLASNSSPENWRHWELPLAGPRPGSPPPSWPSSPITQGLCPAHVCPMPSSDPATRYLCE